MKKLYSHYYSYTKPSHSYKNKFTYFLQFSPPFFYWTSKAVFSHCFQCSAGFCCQQVFSNAALDSCDETCVEPWQKVPLSLVLLYFLCYKVLVFFLPCFVLFKKHWHFLRPKRTLKDWVYVEPNWIYFFFFFGDVTIFLTLSMLCKAGLFVVWGFF